MVGDIWELSPRKMWSSASTFHAIWHGFQHFNILYQQFAWYQARTLGEPKHWAEYQGNNLWGGIWLSGTTAHHPENSVSHCRTLGLHPCTEPPGLYRTTRPTSLYRPIRPTSLVQNHQAYIPVQNYGEHSHSPPEERIIYNNNNYCIFARWH